ncbi:MAG: hypothetical protein V3U71_02535 [Cocleimonas sp.]
MNKLQSVLPLLSIAFGSLTACSTHSTISKKISSKNKSHLGMTCIAPNIYVDPAMSKQQQNEFLLTVKKSKVEITKFFGGMKSRPDIYACTTASCFSKFGGVPAKAKAFDDNKVLLSSRALNKTTLSHELAHVEFHKRLGTPHLWNKIPMWFDEGLAVLACKDSKYSKPVTKIPLDNLVSQGQWINAIQENKPAYNVARQAVDSWYREVGYHGLQAMIIRMKNGEGFSLNASKNPQLVAVK